MHRSSAIKPSPVLCRAVLALGFAAALVPIGRVYAAEPSTAASAKQQYERERARCMSGQSNQDRKTCLTSAGAAYDEAKRGRLDVADHPYDRNKTSRCDPLPPDDRQDCIKRMQGEGTVSGSPAQGGVLRELTTVQPAPKP